MPDHQTVSCECSKCGHVVTQSLAWLSENSHYTCPNCQSRVEPDRATFFDQLSKAVEEGAQTLGRDIAKLNKDLAKIGKKPRK